MIKLARFGVSLERKLLERFDKLLKEKKFTNRSKAIGDLIREELVKRQWQENKEIAGAISLVYNHHKRELVNRLTDIQHDFHQIILSSQHIHLDEDNCLEIVVVKGRPKEAQKLYGALRTVKGVKHGALTCATTGKGLV